MRPKESFGAYTAAGLLARFVAHLALDEQRSISVQMHGHMVQVLQATDQSLDVKRKPGRPRREYAVHRLTIELPADLLAALDAATANRTAFIEAAIRAALAAHGGGDAVGA